jgi:hypothetical protein
MKGRLLLLLLLSFLITTAQEPTGPAPGQEPTGRAPGQEAPEPAPGWFCSPKGQADHQCACQRMDHDPQCEGMPQEDSQCRVYCHKDHCRCPVKCEPQHG